MRSSNDDNSPFTTPEENSMKHKGSKYNRPKAKTKKESETTIRNHYQQNSQNKKLKQHLGVPIKNKPIKKNNSSTKHRATHNRHNGKKSKPERIHNRRPKNRNNNNVKRIHWESQRNVSFESERALLPILLHNGEREYGMMKDQPEYRIQAIHKSCKRNGIDIMQALSLRRHHIKKLNPFQAMEELGLGSDKDVYKTAMKFEQTIENYLMLHSNVPFLTENDQRQRHYASNVMTRMPPTPDFLFPSPVLVHNRLNTTCNNLPIYWLEAKMFYGASTIPRDEKSAVGRILTTAEKYVDRYGPGAIVFAYGCGETLARALMARNVIALDATPLDLRIMKEEQRKWCADVKGRILI